MKEELLFVYNASSDLFSTVTDFTHKIISPSTYQCQLCALTYGNFSMKLEWKSFIERLPMKTGFMHKDEFEKQYHIKTSLPAVFISSKGVVKEIISQQQINSCQTLEELKVIVNKELKNYTDEH
ncbi:MAG: hypothetical protein IPL97_03550 [Niastella sp.]|nr:hypothetical protein [Niastella sp.]